MRRFREEDLFNWSVTERSVSPSQNSSEMICKRIIGYVDR